MMFNMKSGPFNSLIDSLLSEKTKLKLQKILWIQACNMFIVRGMDEFKMVEPRIECRFVPITLGNCHRVADFREKARISQYRDKLTHNEIGFFAEHDGKMIGSIWATINKTQVPRVVQTFQKVMYNEAVVHDNIVSEKFRGMRVGPYMQSNMFALLFKEYGVIKIIADVNIRNLASLRMLEKMGLLVDRKMLYISMFGQPLLQLVLEKGRD